MNTYASKLTVYIILTPASLCYTYPLFPLFYFPWHAQIPLPLFFSSHIFSLADFTAWIAVAFIWAFYAIGVVVIYPIWESRMGLKNIAMGIWKDLRGIGRH